MHKCKCCDYDAVNNQIIQTAKGRPLGEFGYHFNKSYGFGEYLYGFGDGVVAGIFIGASRMRGNMMVIEGTVEYFYDDTFTDPINIREAVERTSDVHAASPEQVALSDLGGTYFTIKDRWKTAFYAEVHPDAQSSSSP